LTYTTNCVIITYKDKIKRKEIDIMAKVAELSPKAIEVLEVLTNSDTALTLADIKELVDGVNSSHLTALKNRGLVNADKIEKEVVTVAKRTVNIYAVAPTPEVE
jgi:chromosome segregation and condensation protein ScpB